MCILSTMLTRFVLCDLVWIVNYRNEDYLTPAEAAKRLRVTTLTLIRWFDSGRIGGIVLPGGHHRYRKEDIARLSPESSENGKNTTSEP
jgi:excisionase family DNA binding protein